MNYWWHEEPGKCQEDNGYVLNQIYILLKGSHKKTSDLLRGLYNMLLQPTARL